MTNLPNKGGEALSLHEVLLKAASSGDLPRTAPRNIYARLMGCLWRMAADDFIEDHPGALNALEVDPIPKEGLPLLSLITEAHCWEKHGVRATDFIFPSFFGKQIRTGRVVDGEFRYDQGGQYEQ